MAVDEAELKIVLRAVATEMLAGMEQARASVDRATASIRADFQKTEASVGRSASAIGERVTVGFSGIQGQIRAFGELAQVGLVLVGVEQAIKNIINAEVEWTTTVDHLENALRGTSAETSTLAVAARESSFTTEQLDTLVRGLGLHLNTSEAEFKNLGIATRDATTGAFRPMLDILIDINREIQSYSNSADRLIVGQRLIGRGASPEVIYNLNKTINNLQHAREVAREFGLAIGDEGVAAAEAFIRAQADLGFALLSVKNIIGGALRPELELIIARITDLARSGDLQAWAENLAEGLVGVGHDIADLSEFLADHVRLLKAAAFAWGAYKASLITATELTAIYEIYKKLNGVIAGIAVIQAAQGLANLGIGLGIAAEGASKTTRVIGTLRAAMLALEITPAGLVAALIATGAALITYEGWWGRIGDAINGAWEALKNFGDEGTAEEAINRRIAAIKNGYNRQIENARAFHDEERALALEHERDMALVKAASPIGETRAPEPEQLGETGAESPASPSDLAPKQVRLSIDQQIQAEKVAYDALKGERDRRLNEAGRDAEAKLQVYRDFAAAVAKLPVIQDPVTKKAEATDQLKEAQNDVIEATRKAEEQKTRIEIIGLQQRADARLKDLTEQQKLIDSKIELGIIPVDQAVAQERAIADAIYRINVELAEKKRALHAQEPEALAADDAAILAAKDQLGRDYAEIDRKTQKESLDEWKTYAKDVADAFSILGSAIQDFLTTIITGTTNDVSALREELRSATVDVQYFEAINLHATDEAINAKQRQIDAQQQLNDAIEQGSNKTRAFAALERDLLQGTIGLLEEILKNILLIKATEWLTGAPASTKGVPLTEQFAGGLLGALGLGPKEAPSAPAPIPTAGDGRGLVAGLGLPGAGGAAALLAGEQQTQDRLTAIDQLGATKREGIQSRSLGSMLQRLFGFGDQATQKVATDSATQATKVAAGKAVETGAVVTSEVTQTATVEASSEAKAAAKGKEASKSILAYAAEAAAGAYAALSDIPVVGPVLGAIAAAAVYAGAIAYASLISFDKGGVVPETGPIYAHKGERVLTTSETESYEKSKGRGGEAGGGDVITHKPGGEKTDDFGEGKKEKKGEKEGGDAPIKHHLEALGASASAAGAALKGVGTGTGGGGGAGVQKVSVVSAPATVSTKITPGSAVTVNEAVDVQAGGDPLPVQGRGIQQVTVTNTPLHVTFSMIGTAFWITTPNLFGIIPSFSFQVMLAHAFAQGGRVPRTGLGLVHEDEYVLPRDVVRHIESRGAPPGSRSGLDSLVEKLTGSAAGDIEIGGEGIGGGQIVISGPTINATSSSGPRLTASSSASETIIEQAPTITANIQAIDTQTGAEFLDGHMRRIANGVAKEWSRRPGARSRP